jgi:ribosomal protein L37E
VTFHQPDTARVNNNTPVDMRADSNGLHNLWHKPHPKGVRPWRKLHHPREGVCMQCGLPAASTSREYQQDLQQLPHTLGRCHMQLQGEQLMAPTGMHGTWGAACRCDTYRH